jgi:hypothetical protein
MSVSLLAGAAIVSALAATYEAFVQFDDTRSAFWFGSCFGLATAVGVLL